MSVTRVRLSARSEQVPASPIRRLAPFAAKARQRGHTVFGLNIGQPDIDTPAEILDRLARFDRNNVPYGPSEGLPEFLEAVARYYAASGLDVKREQVFATTGGSEALLFVIGAIADPGDEVVVFEPFYTNYSGFAGMLGVATVPVTTRAEDGYHLPPRAEIEKVIGPRTRAILLCSPNNPTGTVYSDEELELVGDLCRSHGLYLVADEVYREFTYDGRTHRSAWTLADLDDRVVLTDSLSKRVSMCGARVGWIVSRNEVLLDAIMRMGQARLCPPTIEQYIATALADVPSSYFAGVIEEYQRRRDIVYQALQQMPGVLVRKPEGAFYLCTGLPVDDADRFAEFLLSEFHVNGETVMLAPANGFYATPGLGQAEVRIAYVLDTDRLQRAMNVLAQALAAYPGKTRP